MKEIWKLLELLNEYNCEVLKHTDKWKEKSWKLIMEIDDNHSWSFNSDLYIVSLRYWFIKWLVENDKISNDWIKPRTDLVKEITIVDYKTGDPHTAHTTNPVPLMIVGRDHTVLKEGKLSDLAPTMLYLLGLDIPKEMNGKNLIEK